MLTEYRARNTIDKYITYLLGVQTQFAMAEKPIKKIKKVLDDEDCHYVIYGDMNNSIVCQKDLLTEGSIEEFEKIFQSKIKRKQKTV